MEKSSEWRSAIEEQRRLFKKLQKLLDVELRKKLKSFNNINLADAKRHPDGFDKAYHDLYEAKNNCITIMAKMGRLGDAMKHYSNKNKSLIDYHLQQVGQKHTRFTHMIKEYQRKEQLAKKIK